MSESHAGLEWCPRGSRAVPSGDLRKAASRAVTASAAGSGLRVEASDHLSHDRKELLPLRRFRERSQRCARPLSPVALEGDAIDLLEALEQSLDPFVPSMLDLAKRVDLEFERAFRPDPKQGPLDAEPRSPALVQRTLRLGWFSPQSSTAAAAWAAAGSSFSRAAMSDVRLVIVTVDRARFVCFAVSVFPMTRGTIVWCSPWSSA